MSLLTLSMPVGDSSHNYWREGIVFYVVALRFVNVAHTNRGGRLASVAGLSMFFYVSWWNLMDFIFLANLLVVLVVVVSWNFVSYFFPKFYYYCFKPRVQARPKAGAWTLAKSPKTSSFGLKPPFPKTWPARFWGPGPGGGRRQGTFVVKYYVEILFFLNFSNNSLYFILTICALPKGVKTNISNIVFIPIGISWACCC